MRVDWGHDVDDAQLHVYVEDGIPDGVGCGLRLATCCDAKHLGDKIVAVALR
jgi:hypothetical protein